MKRKRASASVVVNKHPGLEEELNRICKLPDELLSKILSCLSFNEAVRSSVLSIRWKNLWKYANLELDFDCNSQVGRRVRYFDWVNGVVEQLQQHNNDSKIRKFRAVFTDRKYTLPHYEDIEDIDRWLEFAISKRIESLELSFRSFLCDFSEDCYNHIKTPPGLSDIKSLRCLSLRGMKLRDGIIEHFIANCPLLEELSLSFLTSLTKLRVMGTSSSSSSSVTSPLPLKYLEIGYCRDLKLLEIDNAPLLSSLVHASLDPPLLQVENCSSLVDLTLVTWYSFSTLRSFFSCFAQVKSFYWETFADYLPNLLEADLVECKRLERLAIKIQGHGDLSINGLIPLINSCPRLHTLQLFLHTYYSGNLDNILENHQVDVLKIDHKNIKVVEIIEFCGYPMEREFIDYVMKYFVGLKKLVLDLPSTAPCSSIIYRSKAYKIALKIKSEASKTLEVIVIP